MQGSEESCCEEYMPDWLKQCLTCKHAYKTKDNDLNGNAGAGTVNVITKNLRKADKLIKLTFNEEREEK